MSLVRAVTLASTSDTGSGNIKRIRLKGEILQRLRVMRRLGAVALGQGNHLVVAVGEVVDPALTHSRHMVQTVHQVRSPEGVGLGAGDGVALGAHGDKPAAGGVAAITDDGFGGGVCAAPVAAPA